VNQRKKFALVGEYKPDALVGGAALVDEYLVSQLSGFGYQVEHYAVNKYSDDWKRFEASRCDGVIYTNLSGLEPKQLLWAVQSGPPYSLIRHDIPPVFYNYSSVDVSVKAFISRLFANARCTVFVSNLQKQIYSNSVEISPSLVIPPPIDFVGFGRGGAPSRNGLLYLGPVNELRGLRRSIQYWKDNRADMRFHIYGHIEDVQLAKYAESTGAELFGGLRRSDVPLVMGNYQELVHHPNFVDSFCIKVIEAELSGLALAVDREKIGRFSFNAPGSSLAEYMEIKSCLRIAKILDAFF